LLECGIRRVNLEEIYKPFGDNKIDIHSIPSKVFATVTDFDFSKWSHKETQMTRPIQFAMLAASQALEDANWFPKTPEEKEATGVAIGSGIGGLEEIASADQQLNDGVSIYMKYLL
jgi:3-oxoacyl-(acyl-carrier-protein) synthase